MADFTGMTGQLDPNVKKNEGTNFTIFPEGDYKIVILKDTVTDNKKRTGKIWKLKLQIIEGKYTGKTLDDNINIINPSQVCQEIGQGTLRNICELTGIPYPPVSTDPIMGRPLGCHLSIQEFKSNASGKTLHSNNVTSYFPADNVSETVEQVNQSFDEAGTIDEINDVPW